MSGGRIAGALGAASAAFAVLLVLPEAAPAADDGERYRLTAGDGVTVTILGEEGGWSGTIDVDGALRLPVVGRASVEGLTLDAAEARLEEGIAARGFYLSPEVSLALVSYAPILVTGDVREPGSFDFLPNLTAGAAAGLAGGVSAAAIAPGQLALTRAQLSGDLRQLETNIHETAARIARLEAQLAGRTEIAVDRQPPSYSSGDGLAGELLDLEGAILREEAEASDRLLDLWRTELAEVENQISLLEDRIGVQREVIALQEDELAASDELDARGLRTRTDLARVTRSAAEARARLLEIEASLSSARSRRSGIARDITRYGVERRLGWLDEQARQKARLERLQQDRLTTIEKRLAFGDGALAMVAEGAFDVTYTIHRRDAGDVRVIEADDDASLRPGDALDVAVVVAPGGPGD